MVEEVSGQAPPPIMSIVVPVMNGAKYIGATLDSIARQQVAGVEVIVVDGASTDGTQDIVKAHDVPNLKLVSQIDRGQLEALQTGIALATGEIVMWLNGDDILMPDAFRTVIAAFAANPHADFVYADSCAFDEPLGALYYAAGIRDLQDWDHLLFYRQLYSECVYWRRAITRYLPEESYDLRVYTDYAFFLNLRWGRRGLWVDRRLGAFRMREGQNSRAFHERERHEYRRVKRDHCRRIGLSPMRYRIFQIVHAPWYLPRHVIRPKVERGLRKLRRILTADRARKIEARAFYTDWLTPGD